MFRISVSDCFCTRIQELKVIFVLFLEKVKAAKEELEKNFQHDQVATTKLIALRDAITTQFEEVDLEKAEICLGFYAGIYHNIDSWHKAKNVRKNVSRVRKCLALVSASY